MQIAVVIKNVSFQNTSKTTLFSSYSSYAIRTILGPWFNIHRRSWSYVLRMRYRTASTMLWLLSRPPKLYDRTDARRLLAHCCARKRSSLSRPRGPEMHWFSEVIAVRVPVTSPGSIHILRQGLGGAALTKIWRVHWRLLHRIFFDNRQICKVQIVIFFKGVIHKSFGHGRCRLEWRGYIKCPY